MAWFLSFFLQHKSNASLTPVCVWWDFAAAWVPSQIKAVEQRCSDVNKEIVSELNIQSEKEESAK